MKYPKNHYDIQLLSREEFLEFVTGKFWVSLNRYFEVSLLNPSDAEDCSQEVILRMARYGKNRETIALQSLESLVFTIARRLAIDMNRAASKYNVQSQDSVLESGIRPNVPKLESAYKSSESDPQEVLIKKEREQMIKTALAELDELTREVIVLRHLENISSADVAKILSIPEGTVWSRLHRGLDQLRELLKPKNIEKPGKTKDFTPKGKVIKNDK